MSDGLGFIGCGALGLGFRLCSFVLKIYKVEGLGFIGFRMPAPTTDQNMQRDSKSSAAKQTKIDPEQHQDQADGEPIENHQT